jgi:5-methylcytosine-specific restriction endonuclease McrA
VTDTRLPDRWLSDRRIQRLTDAGFRSFVTALMWSVANRTEGVIEEGDLTLMGFSGFRAGAEDEFVQAGLWIEIEPRDGERRWQIEPFTATQTSRDQLQVLDRARAAGRQRQVLYRDPALRRSIRARDCDMCRYCGQKVDWNDRRSNAGGTYDHVIPDGGSTYENCVVACRGCNSRKGRRTPQQACMPLLPPPDLNQDLEPGLNGSSSVQTSDQLSTQARKRTGVPNGTPVLSNSLSSENSVCSSSNCSPGESLPESGTALGRPVDSMGRPNMSLTVLAGGVDRPPDPPPPDRRVSMAARDVVKAGMPERMWRSARKLRRDLEFEVDRMLGEEADAAVLGTAVGALMGQMAVGEEVYPGHLKHIYARKLAEQSATPQQIRNGQPMPTSDRRFLSTQGLKDRSPFDPTRKELT